MSSSVLSQPANAFAVCAVPLSAASCIAGKEALKSGLNIPGVAESYDEGGNLAQARWAQGLAPGEDLPRS